MTTEEIKTQIEKALPGIKLKLVRDSILVENAADLTRVAKFLKEDPGLSFDYLSSVTGSDYLTFLESVYHLYSMEKKRALPDAEGKDRPPESANPLAGACLSRRGISGTGKL